MKKAIVWTLLAACLGTIWYFGHHRPAQKILEAEPRKVYKITTPLTPEKSTGTEHPPDATTREDTTTDAPLTERTDGRHEASIMDDTVEESKENNGADATEQTSDVQTDSAGTAEGLDLDTQWIIDESNRALAESEADSARIKALLASTTQEMQQILPEMIRNLESHTLDEQAATLLRAKHSLATHPILAPVLDEFPPGSIEKAWQYWLDMLVEHGYTLPPGLE